MSKMIKLDRAELVWQTRVNYFGEGDWENLVKWMKGRAEQAKLPENQNSAWYRNQVQEYNIVKDMSWEQALAEYEKWNNEGESEDLLHWICDYGDGYSYTVYFGEWLRDNVREDNYNSDIIDEEYADDYNEEFSIEDEE